MSSKHPILAVTGSSGAGTTTVKQSFEHIFRREQLRAVHVQGDSFHRYNRTDMRERMRLATTGANPHFSHFGPDANLFEALERLFKDYGESGTGRVRHYLHNEPEAAEHSARLGITLSAGNFTPWEELATGTDLLFYEGLHGGVADERSGMNVAQWVDLLIGVVPTVNLEWIQKIHRDTAERGYSQEAVIDTILRRMHDYVHYITPQFSRTHINFQRVPVVDTSNPFVARDVPSAEESLVVIRFQNSRGADFPYLLSMLRDSFVTRPNTLVIPGSQMGLAIEIILTPLIRSLMQKRSAT